MKIIRELSGFKLDKSIITIGTFDGVHLGHQRLIKKVVSEAKSYGYKSVVITFDKLSKNFINPEKEIRIITPLENKIEKMKELKVDILIVINFCKDFASLSPEDFIQKILCKQLGAKIIVAGSDFHFGKNRTGNVDTLRLMSNKLNYNLKIVPFLRIGDVKVSSTEIRHLLFRGEDKIASMMLGEALI